MKTKRTKYSFWIFSDLLKMARVCAEEKRTTVSHVINKALERFLDKGE